MTDINHSGIMIRSHGRLSSSSSAVQPDVPLYEPVLPARITPVRPPPPVPKKPDQRGKNSLARRPCDFSPTCEDYSEIQRVPSGAASPVIPPHPAPSEPVRTDPSDSCSSSGVPLDQHLYEDISELLDGHQDGGDVCAVKGKRYSSSSLTDFCDFQVKSGLLPEKLVSHTLHTDRNKTSSIKHLQKMANPSAPPIPAARTVPPGAQKVRTSFTFIDYQDI
ncbi:uncharacterized protein [Chanodichthys erythropterus]|uniref:uncharacterized protein n=1 Tax=Chanodichthys erythropterus TaxID=933992 RepID=UPI00351E3934